MTLLRHIYSTVGPVPAGDPILGLIATCHMTRGHCPNTSLSVTADSHVKEK